jgi:L-lactate dehydrogenase complex protein LldG
MGPSATADVEATLVHGAQGTRSLNLFFLPPVQSAART